MWKSTLEILYFLTMLYFVLQFQDFFRSNSLFLGISMNSDCTRPNSNLVISDIQFSRQYENCGDLSLTNHSASHNKVMTSFINGSPSNIIHLLTSETLFGMVTVTWLFSPILLRTSKLFMTCLLCFLACGTIWKMSLKKLYKFCFFSELSATLTTLHKSVFLPKPQLSNRLKARKVSLWKKATALICLLPASGMSLLTTLRRWTKLSRLKNKFGLDSSMSPVVSSLTSKPLGTLLILSTLFESGHSSLDVSNMTMISTSLNETSLTTSWTIDSFPQGAMMLSTSPTTAASNATIWLSSSLRTSRLLSSTQNKASEVSLTSTQSSPFVPFTSFQSVYNTVLETRITNVSSSSSSSSPLSSGSFKSPSSSTHINYSSTSFSTLVPPLSLSLSLSITLPSPPQSATILLSSATLSPTKPLQVPLSSLLVSPFLSLALLPSSSSSPPPPLWSPLSSLSSLSVSTTASTFPTLPSPLPSQSQRLPSRPPSSPSWSLHSLSSSSALRTSPSPLLSQSPKRLPSSPPPSTSTPLSSPSPPSSAIAPLPLLTSLSPSTPAPPSSASLSAPSSAIEPLASSASSSPSPPTPPSSASLSAPSSALSPSLPRPPASTLLSIPLSPSQSLSPLKTSSPLPSLSLSLSKVSAPISSSPTLTQLPLSPSLSPGSSSSPTLSTLTTTTSKLTSASLSADSSPLPLQSPLSLSAIPSISPSPSLSPSLSSVVLLSSNNISVKEHTSTVPLNHSSMSSNLTSRAVSQTMASAILSVMSSASSSVIPVPTRTTSLNGTRKIDVTVSLINEDFNSDLLNESSAQFVNLSRRVNSTLWDLFSGNVEGLRDIIILRFRNGSVKVDFQLLVNSKSNVTAQVVNQTLLKNNGTNSQGFIFGNILVQEKCSSGYCFNSGSCQDGADGPVCSCSAGFEGSRCRSQKAVVVNGNFSEWSEFTECSTTCEGGQRRRSRTCTNPPPRNGGKDCRDLGQDVEYIDCNGDVRCPVSAEIWIAVGVACGVFFLILVFVVVLLLRRRRKQAEQRNGLSSSKDSRTNGHSTIIPLEVIYEDRTVPKSTPKGQTNPEFIGDDDDDNDIYKAQLLLFLKQAHLIRPNIYPDEQDNQSDTSEYSRSTSRKPSAVSRTSGTIEEDTEEQAHDVKTSHESNSVTFARQTPVSDDQKTLPTTVL